MMKLLRFTKKTTPITMIKMIKMINSEEIYNRIISGKPYGKDLKPYSQIVLERVIKSFESNEEYEKCIVIKNLSDSRIHENGFKIT